MEKELIMVKKREVPALNKIVGKENNPFIVELKGKMYIQPRANTIVARGQEIIDTSTGEVVQDSVLLGRQRKVDKSTFSKLYASEIGILFELSKSAINVFLHLSKVMDYDNKAIFDYTKEYNKLGYKTYKQCLLGLRELISKNIIYPHLVSGIWWLNPTIVCKGERFSVYTEYIIAQKKEEIDLVPPHRLRKVVTTTEASDAEYEQVRDLNERMDPEVRAKVEYARQASFPELIDNNPFEK